MAVLYCLCTVCCYYCKKRKYSRFSIDSVIDSHWGFGCSFWVLLGVFDHAGGMMRTESGGGAPLVSDPTPHSRRVLELSEPNFI